MRQEKKVKDRPAIALVLFFCLAALVAVFAVTSTVNKVRDNLQIDKAAEVVKKKAVSKTSENTAAEVVDSQDSKSSGSNSSASFIKPLSGEVIQKYSMDMPIYWETLDQYMTHDGIDLAAPAGTSVKTCASGTVTRIEKDDRYGMIVEISHGNDLLSLYGNLAEDGLVELGVHYFFTIFSLFSFPLAAREIIVLWHQCLHIIDILATAVEFLFVFSHHQTRCIVAVVQVCCLFHDLVADRLQFLQRKGIKRIIVRLDFDKSTRPHRPAVI